MIPIPNPPPTPTASHHALTPLPIHLPHPRKTSRLHPASHHPLTPLHIHPPQARTATSLDQLSIPRRLIPPLTLATNRLSHHSHSPRPAAPDCCANFLPTHRGSSRQPTADFFPRRLPACSRPQCPPLPPPPTAPPLGYPQVTGAAHGKWPVPGSRAPTRLWYLRPRHLATLLPVSHHWCLIQVNNGHSNGGSCTKNLI
ncbi:hypothetical protein NMG60_11009301 [Bertholletia excelsa]